MSNLPPKPPSGTTDIAWWRIPQVVFVPAILLAGVLATSAMVVIASMDQDPLLDKAVYERELKAAEALHGQARVDALMAVQPAQQGRNHAASRWVPINK